MLAQEPSRLAIRRLLAVLLRTDSDYTAFCIDYFPAVAHEFTNGLTRTDKTNLLLEQVAGALVLQKLQATCVDVDVQAQLSEIDASLPLAERQAGAQRAELEQLYLLREQRRVGSVGSAELDARIVQLKRAQRESTQRKEGDLLGERYWLQYMIGKGGYARVWQCFDRTARRLVALKILHSDFSEDPRRLERFCRGVAKLRAIHHPHIVSVYSEVEQDGDAVFVAMEYLPGGDLHQAVVHRKLPRSAALRAVIQICDALAYMHAAGMIHRDVKPHNILLTGEGVAKLTDFDLVWAADTTGATRTGSLGTFMYAAPEAMVDGSDATCRADVYSVAMTLLFVLHGRALPASIQFDLGRFIEKIDAPAKLKALLKRATQVDPARRTATVQLLRSELLQAAEPLLREPIAPSAVSPLRGEAALPTNQRSQVALMLALSLLGTGEAAYWWSHRSPAVNPDRDAAKLLVQVEQDLQAKRWPQAIENTSKVISLPGVSVQSRDLASAKRSKAEQESNVKVVYERFTTAASGSNYDQALSAFKEIPEDSVYRSGAREQYDQILPLFVASHVKAAEDGRAQGNCAEFQAQLKVVLEIDSKQVQALAARDRPCEDKTSSTTDIPPNATNTKQEQPSRRIQPHKTTKPEKIVKPEKVGTTEKVEKPSTTWITLDDYRTQPNKTTKPEKIVKPEKVGTTEKVEKPGTTWVSLDSYRTQPRKTTKPESVVKPEKAGITEKVEKPGTTWVSLADVKPNKTEIASADVDQALTNAQTEFTNGNFSQSISMAKAVQRGNPTRAWRIIGAAACNIKDVKLASEAFKHLDSAGRQYMIYACQRQGITSSGAKFKLSEQ